jgi:hypothetical protein
VDGEAVGIKSTCTIYGEGEMSIELVEGAYGKGNDSFYESVGEVGN